MNLIEKWKNRETKKRLKEENIRLKTEIEMLHKISEPPVCTMERNIQQLRSEIAFHAGETIPVETIKRMLVNDLAKCIAKFVEYNFHDGMNGDRIFSATLFVATGGRRK